MCVLGTARLWVLVVTLTHASRVPSPRMKVPDEEVLVRRISVPDVAAVFFGQQPDSVLLVGRDRLTRLSFQDPQQRMDNLLSMETCPQGCRFNITLAHLTEQKHLFLCGNSDTGATCCSVDPAQGSSGQRLSCLSSPNTADIIAKVRRFPLKHREASLLIDSGRGTHLFITSSGSQDKIGLYKLGRNIVSPPNQYREQHYVKLVLSRREDDPQQDKVLAFYNEKNKASDPYGQMWLPYVSQVCLNDVGGSKLILQFTWTSQMSARLFCGDAASRQHFPELVDVATLRAERRAETRIYALFRNQWNISAVCIYTLADIEQVFQNSPFKDSTGSRPRECVPDSTTLSSEVLRNIEKGSELKDLVRPLSSSSPLIFRHHSYTHISVDPSWRSSDFQVLFLTLRRGGVHKVLHSHGHTFVMAAYMPFSVETHVLGATLHPSSKKLYLHNSSHLVQLDVARCSHYGHQCEDCVLARDPDCGWNGSHCTPGGTFQDVFRGNHSICSSAADSQRASGPPPEVVSVSVLPDSPVFLWCPMTSHHAHYVWLLPEGSTSCSSREEHCLLLMDPEIPWKEGNYTCQSTEEGHVKVVRRYHLKQENRGSWPSLSPLLWTLLMAAWTVGLV